MAGWLQGLLWVTAAGVAVRTFWNFAVIRWLRLRIGQALWVESVRAAIRHDLAAISDRIDRMDASQSELKTATLVVLGVLGDLSDVIHRELNHNGGSSMKDKAVQAAQVLAHDELPDEPTLREAMEAAAHKLRQQVEEDQLGAAGRIERRNPDDT